MSVFLTGSARLGGQRSGSRRFHRDVGEWRPLFFTKPSPATSLVDVAAVALGDARRPGRRWPWLWLSGRRYGRGVLARAVAAATRWHPAITSCLVGAGVAHGAHLLLAAITIVPVKSAFAHRPG